MGKLILSIGLLASISLTIGSLFKVMHMPGANVMMYGGILLFCCLFAPVWAFNRMKTKPMTSSEKFSWKIGVTSGIVFAIGNLFELLHYQGAGIMIFIGGLLFALLYLPAIFYNLYQQQSHA